MIQANFAALIAGMAGALNLLGAKPQTPLQIVGRNPEHARPRIRSLLSASSVARCSDRHRSPPDEARQRRITVVVLSPIACVRVPAISCAHFAIPQSALTLHV